MAGSRILRIAVFFCLIGLVGSLAFAQQVGSISGKVTTSSGEVLPGVTVEARSNVLPQARVTTTAANGVYRFPALPPGKYTVQFSLAGMQAQTRDVQVYLNIDSPVDVQMGIAGVSESITVTAQTPFTDPTTTAIKSAIPQEAIERLPVGQEYRDLIKLAPGVQVNEASVRGPAAGGSEQDNIYQFDGVNVTLPLFGTLAAEPSSQDIEQITVVKGGAKAVDFNRSAGFTIDSVSKSGTSEFKGDVKYQFQNAGMTADQVGTSLSQYDQDRAWASLGIGGPIMKDRLYFYGSYYRPTIDRANSSNLYGDVPNFKSTRDEYFGKLTYTPTSKILLNGSYRDSSRTDDNASIGGAEAPSAATNNESKQKIGILEASWVVTDRSYVSAKYNDYALKTAGVPQTVLSVVPNLTPGTTLDIGNMAQMGYFEVPSLIEGNDAFNSFIAPFVDQYGFIRDGTKTGGGAVGGAFQFDMDNFYRKSYQLGYDVTLGRQFTHDIHVGWQGFKDSEDLGRSSNGWGDITVIGGRSNCPADTGCEGQPIYFQADVQRSSEAALGTQVIHSEYQSQNVELNDTMRTGNWSFNVGVLASNDTLYGQGLREDSSTISGYVADPGHKYKMHTIKWSDQIQPRLGVTWAYNGTDTAYVSYARYNPIASSLPRAASWDRNTLGLVTRAYFDQNGALIGSEQLASSSGKLFQQGIKPRYTDEYLIGTGRQINSRWSARAYARYRYSSRFWEDTPNNARLYANAPDSVPHELYIPNLNDMRNQIGSGSSYVIATLDGAFTKYYEATFESNLQATENLYFHGTYTWSHYYGNFDQDATSTTYDFATFIGSSNIADGPGRQVWDNKYGNLHADRRNLLKLDGYYRLPWNATVGAFTFYQSGDHWEAWSYEPYSSLTSSRSDTNRYAEPAGSRTSPAHYQLDLDYTQNIPIHNLNLQLIGDVFNLFDKQTGYSPQPAVHSSLFGQPRLRFAPRRFQLAVRLQF
ncbi:MAG: TonB-dependent receptor [Thermoanaerobaculia bacterium]